MTGITARRAEDHEGNACGCLAMDLYRHLGFPLSCYSSCSWSSIRATNNKSIYYCASFQTTARWKTSSTTYTYWRRCAGGSIAWPSRARFHIKKWRCGLENGSPNNLVAARIADLENIAIYIDADSPLTLKA